MSDDRPENRRLGRGLSALLGEARREEAIVSPMRVAGLIEPRSGARTQGR